MDFHNFSRIGYYILIVSMFVAIKRASCLEEVQQAIFLAPRNFNPHPYQIPRGNVEQVQTATSTERGPILFPPSPPPMEDPNAVVIQRVGNSNANHPVDQHPYPKLVAKHRFGGRFQDDNSISTEVYQGLAQHGQKVLTAPAAQLRDDYSRLSQQSLTNEQKNYAFSYKVLDHSTGDDFSHSQSHNAKATNGEYRVKLPDGRLQFVSYIADKNGYKSDVKYSEGSNEINQVGNDNPEPQNSLESYPDLSRRYENNLISPVQNQVGTENRVIYIPTPTQPTRAQQPVVVITPQPQYSQRYESAGFQPQYNSEYNLVRPQPQYNAQYDIPRAPPQYNTQYHLRPQPQYQQQFVTPAPQVQYVTQVPHIRYNTPVSQLQPYQQQYNTPISQQHPVNQENQYSRNYILVSPDQIQQYQANHIPNQIPQYQANQIPQYQINHISNQIPQRVAPYPKNIHDYAKPQPILEPHRFSVLSPEKVQVSNSGADVSSTVSPYLNQNNFILSTVAPFLNKQSGYVTPPGSAVFYRNRK